jgi:hypothetical protein
VTNVGKVKQKQILSFHPCFAAKDQIILGSRKLTPRDHRIIKKAHHSSKLLAGSYQACKASSANFPNYDIRFKHGKMGQSALFKELRLPHPNTIPWVSVDQFLSIIQRMGFPRFPVSLKGK